jgi:hypothetical protein
MFKQYLHTEVSGSAGKRTAYSAAALAFLAGIGKADGQVVYTDVDPDLLVEAPEGLFYLDIDNDAIDDFLVSASSAAVYLLSSGGESILYNVKGIFAYPLSSNAVAGNPGDMPGFQYPDMLGTGVLVNAALNFQSAPFQSMVYSFILEGETGAFPIIQEGEWMGGATDKFLGLRFLKEGNTHYGWLRLDVAADHSSFTIKDYAYDATPGVGITTDILQDVAANMIAGSVQLYSFGHQIMLYSSLATSCEIQVYDMAGNRIYEGQLESPSMIIDLPLAASGIYVCSLRSGQQVYSTKLTIGL